MLMLTTLGGRTDALVFGPDDEDELQLGSNDDVVPKSTIPHPLLTFSS